MHDVDPSHWSCPIPLRDYPEIVMGHGGGGRLSGDLVAHLFLPALAGPAPAGPARSGSALAGPARSGSALAGSDLAGADGKSILAQLGDSAIIELGGQRLAFSTDTFVVRPRFFPGGNIGDLAVNGTVNDLAMVGAAAAYLSVGMVLEEGMPVSELGVIAQTMGTAARVAGVQIVTGDTKVVDRGHGDGVYINTAGIGLIPPGVDLGPHRIRPGDAVIVSGPIGEHGIAVLSVREGLEFGSEIRSDTAPLNGVVASLLKAGIDVHMMRDPTRGGVGAILNEIAVAAGVGIRIVERDVPVAEAVRAACGFLGLDPMYVANEGRLVAIVSGADAEAAVAQMRQDDRCAGAKLIGHVVAEHPEMVVARTGIGGTRVVAMPLTEQLPRIC